MHFTAQESRMKIRHSAIAAFAATGLILSACSTDPAPSGGGDEGGGAESGEELSGTVTLLLPNTTTTRFIEHDAPAFQAAMKDLAPGVEVKVLNAEGSGEEQLSQAETALNEGTTAIVLVAADPALSGAVLQQAAADNVPVVSYEHEALDGPVTYQVMFDPFKVGTAQGQYFADHLPQAAAGPIRLARLKGNSGDNYTNRNEEGQNEILQPLIDSGDVEVVCEDYTPGWDPAEAQQLMEQCLTKAQDQVDAVMAMNDGTASGAVAALEGQGLAGQVPVYGGQDANLEALRYILQGQQAATVFKDYALEGQTAAELVVAALTGNEPESDVINGEFDNNSEMVPTAYLDVESIDASNMQTVVDAGLYTKEELCEGLSGVEFCG
jgi:D-xylose transport system substrate-binding protein